MIRERVPHRVRRRWPEGGAWDMADLFRGLRSTVLRLEAAWSDGTLRACLDDPGVVAAVGPDLFAAYVELDARSRSGFDLERRRGIVLALLRQLSDEVFSIERWGVVRGRMAQGTATLDTALDGGPAVPQRLDQVAARRFWGLGFVHEDDPDATDRLARRSVRRGVKRCARDLRDLDRILRRAADGVRLCIPSHADRRFEQLMLDILAEDDDRARSASLVEDLCQKTDLRVRYPDVGGRRGTRVQVKSTANPRLHEERVAAIRRPESIVVLSPVTLAGFIDAQQRARRPARVLDATALRAFWRCFPDSPTAIDELAYAIREALFRALERRAEDPRGPLAAVPEALRTVIRVFVADAASRTAPGRRLWEPSHAERRRTAVPQDADAASRQIG